MKLYSVYLTTAPRGSIKGKFAYIADTTFSVRARASTVSTFKLRDTIDANTIAIYCFKRLIHRLYNSKLQIEMGLPIYSSQATEDSSTTCPRCGHQTASVYPSFRAHCLCQVKQGHRVSSDEHGHRQVHIPPQGSIHPRRCQ